MPSRCSMKTRMENMGGWGVVAMLDIRARGMRTKVVTVLTVSVSSWILGLASSPRVLTSMSSCSKQVHFLEADSRSNKPRWHSKHWQVAGKWAAHPIQKKAHLGDQADGRKPHRAMSFSMRHKSSKVTSNDFTRRPEGHREEVFVDVANVSATEASPWTWP